GAQQEPLWRQLSEQTSRFLEKHPNGTVVRVSCTLKELEAVMGSFEVPAMVPAMARAGTGVCYGYFEQPQSAATWMAEAARRSWKAVVEFSAEERKQEMDLWPAPGIDLEMMRRVKHLFDPDNLLNRGRL